MRYASSVAILSLSAVALTGCGSGASYSERMAYLRKIANRGVETHNFIVSQGAKISSNRCSDAYDALQDNKPPSDQGDGVTSSVWLAEVKQFFVDSCVSGLPKPVPGQIPASPLSPSAPASSKPSPVSPSSPR